MCSLRISVCRLALPCVVLWGFGPWAEFAPAANAKLPGAGRLDWDGNLDQRMMDGLHRYIERKIAGSVAARTTAWKRDPSSAGAYEKSVEPNRQRFARLIGLVDPRLPARMERFGEGQSPGLVAETGAYRVWQVRWPSVEGVSGEGLLVEPKNRPKAAVVALSDADQTPEQLVGLAPGIEPQLQFARRLAEAGLLVVVPALVDRSDRWSGNPDVAWTNQPHREWIYRQAYMMGRHVIGYEVAKVQAAVDWFSREHTGLAVGVAGYGEGGLLALYSAAVDPRIAACLTSGYFNAREQTWQEPLYRNVWSLLTEFGDAELATLVAPRGLVVEASRPIEVAGPPPAGEGRRKVAAVGEIRGPAEESVSAEFARIGQLIPEGFQNRRLIRGQGKSVGPGSPEALETLLGLLGGGPLPALGKPPVEQRSGFDPAERQKRQVQEIERHVQGLVRGSDRVREKFFVSKAAPWYADRRRQWSTDRRVPTFPAEPFVEAARPFKKYFWEEVLGKLPDEPLVANPRSRQVYDRPKWIGHEVVLDVFPDVFAWGILLVPKDLKPGERRPVVVCQHGRNGLPRDTIEPGKKAYWGISAELADRGFIVFSPHNPYRGEDRYRLLSRKANGVKASLFSFILAQHEQILKWLGTLPFVDAARIGFYGCSYGGETAVRVPPLLDGYALSICSSDFNDWARKVASTDSPFSFMFTVEWEMPYFDLGSTFNYAEMAYLMFPRPFMAERGHCDSVAPDEWVAYEFAKVRYLYDMLDRGDRAELEIYTGGHCFHGGRAIEFLQRHLRWKADP